MRIETGRILKALAETYPDARCALDHETPYELLVATVLSAQCTDQRVNHVTPRLFPQYGTPERMLELSEEDLSQRIRDCGLFRTKARNILAMSRMLLERHGGAVPDRFEDLRALPGVGRKTANVVLSNAFSVPAIAVDTHVFRVSHRLGLSSQDTPEGVERDLRRRIPRRLWSIAHHWLIFHGRRICHAQRPECLVCPLSPYCHAFRKGLVTPR